jgi:hypothetical protein
MRIMDANTLSNFARKTAESTCDFASVVRNLILDVRDCYRPGVRYMRGPGPKRHAKHHQPWLRFDAEAVPPGGQHDLSPMYVRGRAKNNPAR